MAAGEVGERWEEEATVAGTGEAKATVVARVVLADLAVARGVSDSAQSQWSSPMSKHTYPAWEWCRHPLQTPIGSPSRVVQGSNT